MTTPTASSCSSVCSLPAEELGKRRGMIRREISPFVRRRTELPHGLAWEFERTPEMTQKLTSFVEFERQCCASLHFDLQEVGGDLLRLSVEGDDVGAFEALGDAAPTDCCPGSG